MKSVTNKKYIYYTKSSATLLNHGKKQISVQDFETKTRGRTAKASIGFLKSLNTADNSVIYAINFNVQSKFYVCLYLIFNLEFLILMPAKTDVRKVGRTKLKTFR